MTKWTRPAGVVLFVIAMTVGITACGGDSGSQGYVEPKGAATQTISIEAGNYYFKPDKITAKPGIAKIELTAASGIHDLKFDGASSGFLLEAQDGNGTQTKKIDLKPGTYTFYCDYPGHRAQGMEGTITVK